MTRIVRTHYRCKRPPWKRKPVALDVPAIITPKTKPAAARTSDQDDVLSDA